MARRAAKGRRPSEHVTHPRRASVTIRTSPVRPARCPASAPPSSEDWGARRVEPTICRGPVGLIQGPIRRGPDPQPAGVGCEAEGVSGRYRPRCRCHVLTLASGMSWRDRVQPADRRKVRFCRPRAFGAVRLQAGLRSGPSFALGIDATANACERGCLLGSDEGGAILGIADLCDLRDPENRMGFAAEYALGRAGRIGVHAVPPPTGGRGDARVGAWWRLGF